MTGLPSYFDEKGNILPQGHGRSGRYKIVSLSTGGSVLLQRNGNRWEHLRQGAPNTLIASIARPELTIAPVPQELPPMQHTPLIVSQLLTTVHRKYGLTEQELRGYVATLAVRLERRYCNDHVFDIGLQDTAGNPIRIYYHGSLLTPIRRYSYLSLEPAQGQPFVVPPKVTWFNSPSSCIWDSNLPAMIPVYKRDHLIARAQERIAGFEGRDRSSVDAILRDANRIAASLASFDIHMAIPTYSARRDDVALMLPLFHSSGIAPLAPASGRPLGALVYYRDLRRYTLVTILSMRQAYLSAMLFTDPSNTWVGRD